MWVTGNDLCANTRRLCPLVVVFYVDANGLPISLDADFRIAMSDGSDLFSTALQTTLTTPSILGVVDYTCTACAHYASSGTFQLNPAGAYEGGAYKSGNSIIPPLPGQTSRRWGDINGCSYVPGTEPAEVTCIAQFASGGATASEVYTVRRS